MYDRKTAAWPFDTIHDILRSFSLAQSLLKGRNSPIWRIGNRGVKLYLKRVKVRVLLHKWRLAVDGGGDQRVQPHARRRHLRKPQKICRALEYRYWNQGCKFWANCSGRAVLIWDFFRPGRFHLRFSQTGPFAFRFSQAGPFWSQISLGRAVLISDFLWPIRLDLWLPQAGPF